MLISKYKDKFIANLDENIGNINVYFNLHNNKLRYF